MPSLAPRHQDRHRMAGLSVVSEGEQRDQSGRSGRPLRLSRLAGRPDALCVVRAAYFRVVHRMDQRFSAQSKEAMMMIRRGSGSLPPAADKKPSIQHYRSDTQTQHSTRVERKEVKPGRRRGPVREKKRPFSVLVCSEFFSTPWMQQKTRKCLTESGGLLVAANSNSVVKVGTSERRTGAAKRLVDNTVKYDRNMTRF